MPTQEELNAAQVELDIANDNYAALANKYNQYNQIFEAYKNASPEAQKKAADVMKKALDDYSQVKNNMYAAEDRIASAQNNLNTLKETIAIQQAAASQSSAGQKRRVIKQDINETITPPQEGWTPIYNDKGDIVGWQGPSTRLSPRFSRHTINLRRAQGSSTPATAENWEDIYNSGGWNEYKKGFNNALVDDLVLPVANAFGASDDTMSVLSELKMPATDREMASKYYAYGGRGKDWADAILQYLGLKGAGELLGLGRASSPAYTVADSSRGIYNTPNAWKFVNRAGSNYSPAYLNGSRLIRGSSSAVTPAVNAAQTIPAFEMTPTEAANFWKYVDANPNASVFSTVNNFANRLL